MGKYLEKFLSDVEAFCERHSLSLSEYGELAMNDRSFMLDLRAGKRAPRISTLEKNAEFMANYKVEAAGRVA